MSTLHAHDLIDLAQERTCPCVSIYMPTHPGGADGNHINWKNLVTCAEQQLDATGIDSEQRNKLLENARNLLNNPCFWLNTGHGLAHFSSDDFQRTITLPLPPMAQVAVGSRFRILPILKFLSFSHMYYVLAISMNDVRLLHCEGGQTESIPLYNTPLTLEGALREHDRDDAISFHTVAPGSISGHGVMYHGHGVGIDDTKTDQLRYFQRINKGVMKILHSESAPLVLASVASLWPIYQNANTYPHLLSHGVPGNPDAMDNQLLMEKALPIVMEWAESKHAGIIDRVMNQSTTGQIKHDLNTVVTAARNGLVEILLIQHQTLDPNHSMPDEALEALDMAASCTLEHRGNVMVISNRLMPQSRPFIGLLRKTREEVTYETSMPYTH